MRNITYYNEIISMIPSVALKGKIKETNFQIPDIDLLRIVYHYAESFDSQIKWLDIIAEDTESDEVQSLSEYCKQYLLETKKNFEIKTDDCVFELCIKDSPDVPEEKYLCTTLSDALRMIGLFYEKYADVSEESDKSRYRIVKRRVFGIHADDNFEEDKKGEAEYRIGGLLYRVDYYSDDEVDCTFDCDKCKEFCMNRFYREIPFPRFLKPGDIVEYDGDPYGEKHTSYCFLDFNSDEIIDLCYLIPLDTDEDYSNEGVYHLHDHVPAAEINLKPEPEITEDERKKAKALCKPRQTANLGMLLRKFNLMDIKDIE